MYVYKKKKNIEWFNREKKFCIELIGSIIPDISLERGPEKLRIGLGSNLRPLRVERRIPLDRK